MKLIAIARGEVLLLPSGDRHMLPESIPEIAIPDEAFRFDIAGEECVAFDVDSPEYAATDPLRFVGIRESYRVISEADYRAVTKGAELLYWDRTVRRCSRCGGRLSRFTEISKRCTDCGTEYFPSLSPCIIVLVTRGEGEGEEALLVHAANFKRPFFGLVAGFVETGESLEQCVAREVREETGLEISDIRYYGSQPWPFPAQLMIGFTARWKSGEVRFADGELTAGGFFRRDNIPMIPTPPSIARQMIDAWLATALPE